MLVSALIALHSVLSAPPHASVELHNGTPTLFIDHEPQTGLFYMTYNPNAEQFAKVRNEAGLQCISISATPSSAIPYANLAPEVWTAPNTWDYSAIDQRIEALLNDAPDAHILLRLFLGTPEWWAESHPKDLVLGDRGDGERIPLTIRRKRVASFASEAWRKDTARAIEAFVTHVQTSPYADHIIGYHLASGMTEEWMQWLGDRKPFAWGDYSSVNEAKFRDWLRAKYVTNTQLKRAWNDPHVSFMSARIPARPIRRTADFGYLRNPITQQQSIDFAQYTSWVVSDTILYLSKVTKDAVKHQQIVGVFYGYVVQLAGAHVEQTSGHHALRAILDSPDIDFITSPDSYSGRELGTGFPHTMSVTRSVLDHGKLWINENDQRTWIAKNVPETFPGYTKTYEDSLLAQQREFGWVLSERLGMWWFDMGGGWYDDPRILADIQHMTDIAEKVKNVSGESIAEVAFVVDDAGSAYLRSEPNNPLGWSALNEQIIRLGHIGAPIDVIWLGDLPTAHPYKLYIFANAIHATSELIKTVRELEQREDASLLWVGVAGVYRDGVWQPGNMAHLTGFPLELHEEGMKWVVKQSPAAKEWGWLHQASYGTSRAEAPLAIAKKAGDYTVLGHMNDTKLPGLIVRQTKGGGYVFHSTAPRMNAYPLRAIAEKSGVHLYLDRPGIVWGSTQLLSINVDDAGEYTVRLPHDRKVVDLWDDKVISEKSNQFTLRLPEHGTALLYLP